MRHAQEVARRGNHERHDDAAHQGQGRERPVLRIGWRRRVAMHDQLQHGAQAQGDDGVERSLRQVRDERTTEHAACNGGGEEAEDAQQRALTAVAREQGGCDEQAFGQPMDHERRGQREVDRAARSADRQRRSEADTIGERVEEQRGVDESATHARRDAMMRVIEGAERGERGSDEHQRPRAEPFGNVWQQAQEDHRRHETEREALDQRAGRRAPTPQAERSTKPPNNPTPDNASATASAAVGDVGTTRALPEPGVICNPITETLAWREIAVGGLA